MAATDDFISYLKGDRAFSARSVEAYGDALRRFSTFLQEKEEDLTPDKADTDLIRQWMAHRMAEGVSARTVALQLSALRAYYKYLLRTGRIERDPTRLLRNPKVHRRLPTFVKQSEMDSLFDKVAFADNFTGRRDRTMLLTFYHTGLRVSELIGLTLADVDCDEGELKVTGKRNKQRIIPFATELADALRSYIHERLHLTNAPTAPSEVGRLPLFVTPQATPLSYPQVRAMVAHYLGLVTYQKKRSPHVLRHTFATAMLNNGADLEAIKQLLGHESIGTTEVYTHTTFADLKKEYELAHPRA